MIPLTLAEVAARTGGRLHPPTRRRARRQRTGRRRLARGRARRPVRRPGREHADGHDFVARPPRGRRGRRARRPRGRRRCPASSSRTSQAALGRARPRASSTAPPASRSSASPGRRQDTTKDLLASVLPAVGPTVAPRRVVQQRDRPAADRLRVDPSTRFLVLEMGARGIGHIAYLRDDRAAADRRGAQRRRRAPRRVRLARGDRQAKGELRRGAARRRASRCSTPTTRWSPRWPRAPGPGACPSGSAAGADVRADDVPLDAAARPAFTLRTPAGRGGGRAAGCTARTTSATPSPPRPSRSSCGLDLDAVAAALSRGRAGSAAGGWRSPSGPTA